jgi:hypothetical protein
VVLQCGTGVATLQGHEEEEKIKEAREGDAIFKCDIGCLQKPVRVMAASSQFNPAAGRVIPAILRRTVEKCRPRTGGRKADKSINARTFHRLQGRACRLNGF